MFHRLAGWLGGGGYVKVDDWMVWLAEIKGHVWTYMTGWLVGWLGGGGYVKVDEWIVWLDETGCMFRLI